MSLQEWVRNSILECLSLINDRNEDRLISTLDSIIYTIDNVDMNDDCLDLVKSILEIVVDRVDFNTEIASRTNSGRPKCDVSCELIAQFFSLGFNIMSISKLLGVSRMTLYRRLKEESIHPSRYTDMNDDELDAAVVNVLMQFPNSGYRRVQGYLQSQNIFVPQHRIRQSVKRVDPRGVFQRTMSSRIIVRRKYFVQHSNDVWHIDTHMKLVRWKISIRGGIDGKSRLIVFLEADTNNKAVGNLSAFLKAVETYGLPSRTRTDKGLENILIARYMLETRGINRGSHICGKSVHNQRIERLWRDVFYGLLAIYYNLFSEFESAGLLNINNPKHLAVLHYVFIPRINAHLENFSQGYNAHPLSTEGNKTPQQLFIMHLGDIERSFVDQRNINSWNSFCNSEADVQEVFARSQIIFPENDYEMNCQERETLANIDPVRSSNSFGADIYEEAITLFPQDSYV